MEGSHSFSYISPAIQGPVPGFAFITWSNECPVSKSKELLIHLLKTLPDDTKLWYFRTIKQKSDIAKGWSRHCQIMLSSKSFTGSITKPQQLEVAFGPRLVINYTDNVK